MGINEKLSKLLLENEAVSDFKKSSRAAASAVLSNLDAVNREEFDAFCEILMRLKKQVEEMEQRIIRLEEAAPPTAQPAAAETPPPAATEAPPPAADPQTGGLQLKKV